MSDQQTTRFYGMNNPRYTATLLIAVFAAMAYFSWSVVSRADRQKRDELLQQTRLVAQALEVEQVQALSGTEADIESPHYQRLKEHLVAVRSANLQCRFVYIMGRRADGTIFFFVDSEQAGSKDYSPPGQIYNESTTDLLSVFDTKASAVEGPVTDRWGTWISTMVPMIDPRTDAVVAVLGMDVNANVWKWDVAESVALPLGLMLVLLIVVVTSFASVRRIDASPKPVLRRLMPPLTVMVILLIIVIWALMYQHHRMLLAKEIAVEISEVSKYLNVALDQQAFGLSMAARSIAADVNLQNDLRIRDVGHLLATWRPIFETLQLENHLTHFNFYDSNRVCLLRVHNPDKRGDLIDRFTTIEAERTGKTASGVELGPLGTFTFRMVQPVFEGGKLVGYVELGKEIEEVLKSMHSLTSNQLVATIRKEHLNRNTWEEGMHLLGRETDWDRLPHSVIIYSTLGYLPDAVAQMADYDVDHTHGEMDREIVFDGKSWLVSTITLPDVLGAEIGDLLILMDVTAEKSAFARLSVLSGTVGAVLLALLLSFIYILLHRTDKGIQAQHAELQGSEERFRLLFDGNKDAIYVYRLNEKGLPGRFIQVNQEACLRLGYLRAELLRMTPLDIAAPGMAEVQVMVAEKLKKVGSSLFETALLAKDGRCIPVECFDRVLTMDGELTVLSTSRDITERKQTEDALKESEEKFRLMFSSSPDAVNINRLEDGLYVDINDGFIRATGYTREEVIGRTSLEISIWHDPADRQKLVQGLQEKGYYENLEAQFQRKDGSLITALMSARVISLKGVSHIISLTRDITDRKIVENALLESRRRLSDVIEFLPDATLAIDREKRIIIWNREIEKMTGVPAAEMIGKSDYAYTIPFYGEARPQLMDLIFMDNKDIAARYPNLIREGDSLVAEVFCNALYNNKGAWVFLKASPLHDQSGNIIGAIESIRDITERKQAEEALRESEEKLHRSKKMESLGLLAGGVAHDLNNVLSGIVSYPELILMDLPDDSVFRKPIQTMKDSGYRAVAIVQDLLTVVRGVANIKAPTNLNDLIRDYLKSPEFKTLLQFHPEAVIRSSLEMGLLNVNGSQIHIQKVLMNLVSNAVEALPEKGTVTLTTMNRYIERPIKGYEDVAIGEYAVLSVSDDGPGISGDDLERIFEPFYSKKVMGRSGTGLGLAVVWNVVQDHKGYIDVTTGMNGTTFELYFPITRDELAKENLPIFIDELMGNGETILVVDDVASQRTISSAILNKLGYRTTAVSSGEEAVEFLKENPVDMLLLDMIMDPGINGCETYARALVIRPEQKAIIISGFAETEDVIEAKKLGAVQFLRKPVSIEKIGLAVKKALVNDSISITKPTATVFKE